MFLALSFSGLLGQKDGLDVRENTSLGDGHSCEKLVQLLVVPDGELKMTGVDPRLLVVAGGVAGQLQYLSGEVFHDGRQVDGGSGSNTLGVVAFSEMSVDSSHGELETSSAGARLGLSLGFSSLSTSRHDFSVTSKTGQNFDNLL